MSIKAGSWPDVVAGDFRMSKRDLEDAASCQHHLIYTGPEEYLEKIADGLYRSNNYPMLFRCTLTGLGLTY